MEKYNSFLKTFSRETHGVLEHHTFVNDFKKIVTNMQYIKVIDCKCTNTDNNINNNKNIKTSCLQYIVTLY